MEQDINEIEEKQEHNKWQSSLFDIWPVIMFFLGLIIAAMAYNHTM